MKLFSTFSRFNILFVVFSLTLLCHLQFVCFLYLARSVVSAGDSLSRPQLYSNPVLSFILPAGSAAGSSAGMPILGLTRCTDQGQIWQGGADRRSAPKFDLDRFRGGGLRPPKLKKKSNFTNIIVPKGRVPCTIFYKIYRIYARP